MKHIKKERQKTCFRFQVSGFKERGFTLLEVLVSVAIFSFILLAVVSSLLWLNYSNSKLRADTQTMENARRAIEIITYEIKGAKSVYTPTTTLNQLSLETLRYLPTDEKITFIDFFLCGSAICLKKESQSIVALTSDLVEVKRLEFSHFLNGSKPSVKIDLKVDYKNPSNDPDSSSSASLTSTASLRSY